MTLSWCDGIIDLFDNPKSVIIPVLSFVSLYNDERRFVHYNAISSGRKWYIVTLYKCGDILRLLSVQKNIGMPILSLIGSLSDKI